MMRARLWKRLRGTLCLAIIAPIVPAAAQPVAVVDEAANRLGARADVLQISLSPSGTKVAYVAAGPEYSEMVYVFNLAGDLKDRLVATNREKITDIDWCEWATDSRLVCQVSGMAYGSSRVLLPFEWLFAVNDDGSKFTELSQRQSADAVQSLQYRGDVIAFDVGGEQGQILMSRQYVPEVNAATRTYKDQSGFGVDLVDAMTAKRRVLEGADEMAVRYVADEQGWVRIKARALRDNNGRLTGEYVYLYRAPGGSSWTRFENLMLDGQPLLGFTPVAVDSARNVAYGFTRRDGYAAVVEVPLNGNEASKVLMARGDVDVDALIRIGRKRRVVGASYATEKREVAYFDPEFKKLAAGLAKALPDTPLINFVGASSDERRILLIASSDTQPGMVYLYDKDARSLEPLLPVRAELAGKAMGTMKPVTYPAADGTMIPAYLTLPPGSDGKGLPAIVLPHGGPSARDEWGFDWLVQYFTAKGYAVLQPNYRGSSGYGDAWYGRNGFKAWETAIGDVNDAGRWLVREGIAKPDKLAIVGWSYGGYAALQSQVLDPALFKAVVAIAPVSDLGYLTEDAQAYTNSRLVRDFVGTGAHVEAGSPRRQASRFVAPVALFHGTRDLNVDVRHSQGMAKALEAADKRVIYREYEDIQHALDDSTVRASMLTEIGAFLETSMASK